MAFIEVRAVGKSFRSGRRARRVLHGCSLQVERGEFVAILGAMGSGKSTLMNILAGVIAPDEGSVAIDGEPVRGVRPDAGVVFQHYSLLPWCTALENVRLAVDAAHPETPAVERREKAARALQEVGLGAALLRRPSQLSGGMRQRVALARALATSPALLFLDEPFGALDAITRGTLQQDLMRLCRSERAVTVVMITNSVDEAILLSDRIVPMMPGPPSSLGEPIQVDLPRPRMAQADEGDHAVWRMRAEVLARLSAQVGRA